MGFPTRSDTYRAVQPHIMAGGLKFQTKEVQGLLNVVKTKVLISRGVTAQLICIFVFLHMQKVIFLMMRLIVSKE